MILSPIKTDRQWREVKRQNPCLVCGRHDWCGQTTDGDLLRCMRADGDTPAGYRFIRDHADGGRLFGRLDGSTSTPTPPRRQPQPKPTKPAIDFAAMHATCRAAIEPGEIADWADDALGLDGVAVDALLPGWSVKHGCYCFPERDGTGAIVGLLLRFADGTKKRVYGSRCGLSFVPPLPPTGTILVVEGPSDVAAATQAGFVAVGRPSNTGGGAMLAELLKGRRVIVLGENDMKPDGLWPGRDGAEGIARQLVGVCESVAVVYPPDGVKDIRAWLIGGAL